MKTKVFTLNEDQKIEFTEEELKSLLDEIYNDGYYDGRNSRYYYYSTPYKQPYYYTWCSSSTAGSSGININGTSTSDSTFIYECPDVTSSYCKCDKEKK